MHQSKPTNSVLRVITISAVILIFSPLLMADSTITKTLTIESPDDILLMSEFGGLIAGMEDAIEIQMVLPANARHEDYKSLDIQGGDAIKMANGKSISSIKQLKEIYNSTEIGDVVKLGISRDGKMMLRKFDKADPENLPGQMSIMTISEDGGEPMSEFVDIGLMLVDKNGVAMVDLIINNMLVDFNGPTPEKGDIISQIQGQDITSIEHLADVYKKAEPGTEVSLTLIRGDKRLSTAFIMPKIKKILGPKPKLIKKKVGQ